MTPLLLLLQRHMKRHKKRNRKCDFATPTFQNDDLMISMRKINPDEIHRASELEMVMLICRRVVRLEQLRAVVRVVLQVVELVVS